MKFTTKSNPPHNKGLKLKLYFGKVCHLIPSMKTEELPFYRKSCRRYSLVEYDLIYSKIFSWFWFRFSVTLESMGSKLEYKQPYSDKFFNMLPPSISVVGEIYYLNISKKDLISVSYVRKDGEEEKHLMGKPIIDGDLTEVLFQTVLALKESDNIRFMRYNYKKMFEDYFKIKIPVERKFEPYYE